MMTAQAMGARRRQAMRGQFLRTKGEQRYAPSAEALSFRPNDVCVSVGDA